MRTPSKKKEHNTSKKQKELIQLRRPLKNSGLKDHVDTGILLPMDNKIIDAMNCGFFGALWQGVIDGVCFQIVAAVVEIAKMLLGII